VIILFLSLQSFVSMKSNQKREKRPNGSPPRAEETPVTRYRSLVISYLSILARLDQRSIQKTPEPLLDSLGVSLSKDKMHCTTVSVKVPHALGDEESKRRISELEGFLAKYQEYIPHQTNTHWRRGHLWPKRRKEMEAKRQAEDTTKRLAEVLRENNPLEEAVSDSP